MESLNKARQQILDSNTIPPIIDELGRGWRQPATSLIDITSYEARMSQETFDKLAEYSQTNPSGVYAGKMWKSHLCYVIQPYKDIPKVLQTVDYWLLKWFGNCEKKNHCSNNKRKITITNEATI